MESFFSRIKSYNDGRQAENFFDEPLQFLGSKYITIIISWGKKKKAGSWL